MSHKESILIYTFSWSGFSKNLSQLQVPSFVLSNKLTKDLPVLIEFIQQIKPTIVLGIAQSKRRSRQEKYAINNFHGRQLNSQGPERYELELLDLPFWTNYRPGHTFCNYSSYKISEALEGNTRLAFTHLSPKDNNVLLSYINNTVIIPV